MGTPRVVGFFVSFSFALIDFVLVSILLFYSKGRLVSKGILEGKIQPGQEKATSKEEIKKRAPLSLTRAISERNLCSLARDKVRISFVTSNQPPVTSSNSKRNNETLIARFKGHIAAVACTLCFFVT